MAATDEDLRDLRRSLTDPAAFDGLFHRHHVAIRRYLHARLPAPELAEDLAAETFARAFAGRTGFRDKGHGVRPWLFQIATNLLRDELRVAARPPRYANERTVTAAPGLPTDPELTALLAGLPRAQLEVLLLHAWADLSYDEIAIALGIRVGTVRSRLNRARTHLQRVLPTSADPGRTPITEGTT